MFLLFNIILCENIFFIKLSDQERYITAQPKPRTTTNILNAGRFKLEPTINLEESYIVDAETNNIFDIAGGFRDLILFKTRHGKANQRFIIKKGLGNKSYIKSANGKCLKYIAKKDAFQRQTCTLSNEELFEIIFEQDLKTEAKLAELEDESLKIKESLMSDTCNTELTKAVDNLEKENQMLKEEMAKLKIENNVADNFLSNPLQLLKTLTGKTINKKVENHNHHGHHGHHGHHRKHKEFIHNEHN